MVSLTQETPKAPTQRNVRDGRLVYYKQEPDPAYWAQVWRDKLNDNAFAAPQRGSLGHYERIFPRYLTPDMRILEGGCGLGQFVLALHRRGYQCEGVDWSEDTVRAVRDKFPELNLRAGDVLDLDVADETYDAYISLGVVEHREEGPEPFLAEALRVLKPGGVFLVSVPFLNGLRRFKASLSMYAANVPDYPFYQYAFTAEEFEDILTGAGFQVRERFPYDVAKGVKDEIRPVSRLFRLPGIGWRSEAALERSIAGRRACAHMIMYAAVKPCPQDPPPESAKGNWS